MQRRMKVRGSGFLARRARKRARRAAAGRVAAPVAGGGRTVAEFLIDLLDRSVAAYQRRREASATQARCAYVARPATDTRPASAACEGRLQRLFTLEGIRYRCRVCGRGWKLTGRALQPWEPDRLVLQVDRHG